MSEEGCNGDVSPVNGNGQIMPSKDEICLSTAFDVDKIVEYLNHSLGEGMAEKSRYSSFFCLIHICSFFVANNVLKSKLMAFK